MQLMSSKVTLSNTYIYHNKLEFMFMKHYVPNRCEPSIEVIVEIGVQWEGGRGWVGGGQGGCERRSEVILKIQKKIGVGGQFRVDVN